jgi:hypothetical protein
MRATERIPYWLPTMALAAEPALVRPDNLAAVGAVLEIGRSRWLGHGPRLTQVNRFGNAPLPRLTLQSCRYLFASLG